MRDLPRKMEINIRDWGRRYTSRARRDLLSLVYSKCNKFCDRNTIKSKNILELRERFGGSYEKLFLFRSCL